MIEIEVFGLAVIYASTNYISTRSLWNNLAFILNNQKVHWCLIGDYNVVLEAHEHKVGASFTWFNGRLGEAHTLKMLDKFIFNMYWLDLCFKTSCKSLPKVRSDHHPLLLNFSLSSNKLAISYIKILHMWTTNPSCLEVIKTSWQRILYGCAMFVLIEKLKVLKKNLNIWNHNTFGNVHTMVKQDEVALNQVQLDLQNDIHFVDLRNRERD
ncbi:hypothetical protein KIW84_041675 [Lathyrus oleraceus]|uniref:Uncharacterized protein n=1 Tax=Pisum sativum TaxID=3888 RepID=A0A9D5APL5_PEA|nr:hypothetical protein KIW84_041675 [Pisum sativum]